MKKNMGIWIDTSQAVVIKLSNNDYSVKKIESNIETRERVPGETKKYGRFGNQYLTYEKHRENKRNQQTGQFLKELLKEIDQCDEVVLFGPSTMKYIFEKEIRNNMQMAYKLKGVETSELLTENQMVAWTKNYYKSK